MPSMHDALQTCWLLISSSEAQFVNYHQMPGISLFMCFYRHHCFFHQLLAHNDCQHSQAVSHKSFRTCKLHHLLFNTSLNASVQCLGMLSSLIFFRHFTNGREYEGKYSARHCHLCTMDCRYACCSSPLPKLNVQVLTTCRPSGFFVFLSTSLLLPTAALHHAFVECSQIRTQQHPPECN